jgi:hypothetical protein
MRPKKGLDKVLYCYVTPKSYEHAKSFGKKKFGSFSMYVDKLILKDIRDHKRRKPLDKTV